jgi:hypothetical protein
MHHTNRVRPFIIAEGRLADVSICEIVNTAAKGESIVAAVAQFGLTASAVARKFANLSIPRIGRKAQEFVRQWEAVASEPKAPQEPMTIQAASDAFVTDAEDQKLADSTISKYRLLFKQLGNFAQNRGLRCLNELSLQGLGEFCSSWKDGPRSSAKKLGGSRLFFVLHKIGTGSQRIQQAS